MLASKFLLVHEIGDPESPWPGMCADHRAKAGEHRLIKREHTLHLPKDLPGFFLCQAMENACINFAIHFTDIFSGNLQHCGQSFLAAYSASKAALANVTRNAANALRSKCIHVNGINCGWMDTPGEDAVQRKWHGAGDDWLQKAEADQPFGQLVQPDHVAGLASYLLSSASGVMTGAVIDFDQNVAGSFPE